jgi:hypothetical protein
VIYLRLNIYVLCDVFLRTLLYYYQH